MSEPKFKPVSMQEMMDEGVLMAANEQFFWKLGLALTWSVEDGKYKGRLHLREWVYDDGHKEAITLADDDEIGWDRRERYRQWYVDRQFALRRRPRVKP